MKLLVTFLFTLSISVSARDIQNTPVGKMIVNYTATNQAIAFGKCSGLFVEQNTKSYFVTAAHCFNKRPKKRMTIHSMKKSSKKYKGSKKNIRFSKNTKFSVDTDMLITEVSLSQSYPVSPFRLSTQLPLKGQNLYAVGYPKKGRKSVHLSKLKCTFEGTARYWTDFTPKTIARVLKCPTGLKSLQGISGGGVVNTNGELVGIISAEFTKEMSSYNGQDKNYIYLFFHELLLDMSTTETLSPKRLEHFKNDPDIKLDSSLFEYLDI